jgi:hypothetical protein
MKRIGFEVKNGLETEILVFSLVAVGKIFDCSNLKFIYLKNKNNDNNTKLKGYLQD